MHDLENVIKALHCRAQGFEIFACDECEYQIQIANRRGCDYMQICRDALSLLKEQEAVEPIPPTDESDLWKCGNCNHQLLRCTHQRYCEMCGQAVKWE